MKKVILGLLIIAICCTSIFATGGKDAGASGKEKVVFYTWMSDAERSMSEALIADFRKAHPNIEVEENYVAYNDYLPKINTMVASGSTPDVFYLNEYLVNEWGEKGVTEDQTAYYKAAGIDPKSFYVDSAIYSTQGKLWGINTTSTTIVLYYNKKLFREAGITPPPADAKNPWTWDQYVAAAKKLTKDNRGRTPNDAGFDYANLTQYGTIMPTSWIYVLPILYAGGSSVANAAGTSLEITSANGVKIIQSIANLALVDKVAPTVAMSQTNAFSNVPVLLMNDQLGMFIGGTFQFSDFTNEGYDVGIAQIPSPTGKGNNMAWSSGYAMKKGGSQAAWELAQYLTNFENWITASKNHKVGLTGLPQTRSVLTTGTPQNKAWLELFDANMAKVSADILANGSRLGENVTLKNFAEIMDQTIAPVLDRIWLGNATAQQALPPLNDTLRGKLQGVWQ
jgi:multiple sugar transport system substrate-binding protein